MGTDARGDRLLRNRQGYLDEDDVRVRAGRGSRPRTRRRPAHESATEAFVVNVDRGRYGCLITDSAGPGGTTRSVTAMKARELGRNSVVVGDRVALAGDTSGAAGTLARIVRVEERTSVLRRSPDDADPLERIIVANAEQMVIVCALADPAPRLRFVDRCLVAAYDASLDPLLVLTKSDLASPRQVRAFYRPLGLPMLTTRQPIPAQTLSRLRRALDGRISVLIGQSGVGKSTLVNELVPDAGRAVGTVNPVTGRGRHTSSSAIALPLPPLPVTGGRRRSPPVTDSPSAEPGWLIDTPGVRGFGLGHVSVERVVEAFGDLAEGTAACPPGCDHLSEACALDEWALTHHAKARLDSLRRLLRSRDTTDLAAARRPDHHRVTCCMSSPARTSAIAGSRAAATPHVSHTPRTCDFAYLTHGHSGHKDRKNGHEVCEVNTRCPCDGRCLAGGRATGASEGRGARVLVVEGGGSAGAPVGAVGGSRHQFLVD